MESFDCERITTHVVSVQIRFVLSYSRMSARITRREALIGLGAGLLAAGGWVRMSDKDKPESRPKKEEPITEAPEPSKKPEYVEVERNEYFDGNAEFLAAVTAQRGEYTKAQRKKRRRVLKNGEEVFKDVGLTFYLVKQGDTISEIKESLSKYDEFFYLREQGDKLSSFNIPAKKLRAQMWIPIPMESKDRHLTEAQFISYANAGIDEMLVRPEYGREVERILARVSRRELVATMIAIAKQEGGGKPLGQFELHRWEAGHLAFSFSYFHIVMKGPGLKARRTLNLTEGQLYHPKNAVKVFLAFLIEKNAEVRKHADRFFPLMENLEAFARFYNGSAYKKKNPDYVGNVRSYHQDATEHLDEEGKRWKKD